MTGKDKTVSTHMQGKMIVFSLRRRITYPQVPGRLHALQLSIVSDVTESSILSNGFHKSVIPNKYFSDHLFHLRLHWNDFNGH